MQSTKWQNKAPRALVAGLALGVSTVAFTGMRGHAAPQNSAPPVQPSAQVLSIQTAFEQVAEKLRPSVVYIKSRQSATNAAFQGGQDGDNPFGFALPQGPGGRPRFMNPQSRRSVEASGSGVIVSNDGYILTNDHVVAGADRVTVTLQDGREMVGKVFRDQRSDLALIKINASGLPAAEFADSDSVKIGQWAIAFGSPFGLTDTMTVGVVSSTKRKETIGGGAELRNYPSLIQTDASINPGNSGGPLVDIYGRVVGINVAIESPSGGNVGIGFTIPANQARYIMEQLRSKGTVTRGYLGFIPQSLDYEAQKRYGVKEGALVTLVQSGQPADRAGLLVEDVIVKYNNKTVEDEATLRDMVSRTAPNTTVPVVVLRDGEPKTLMVTVGVQQIAEKAAAAPAPAREHTRGKLGMSLGEANDAKVRQELSLKDTVKDGIVVVEALQGGPAFEAGIRAGDVLVRINGKRITSVDQVSQMAVGMASGDSVSVVVRRADETGSTNILATLKLD